MLCPNCAYDLRGQSRNEFGTFRCPECGEMSVGTASRGEVIAAYRSWRGAFGGGLLTLGARYLDAPAIMRTVGRRYMLLLGCAFVIPTMMLLGSTLVVTSRYDRWWSPVDSPTTRMDVDSVEGERRLIDDPNDSPTPAPAMRNAAHGDRLYQTELIKRSIRFELPRWPRVERALTVLLGSALGVTVPMLIAIATCRLLLMLSPDMPARASFRRSIGMAGYAIMPTTVQFSAMILSVAFSFFEPRRNPFGPSASLAGCCGILALLWTGVLMATLPWITLPDRDTARRITCGIVMLIAYWTPFAIAMSR